MKVRLMTLSTMLAGGALLVASGFAQAKPPAAECTLLGDIARDGMLEVKLGELAKSKGTSADVKKFAEHMVMDHSKANEKLKEAAKSDGVTLPGEISAEQKAKLDKLSGMKGGEFDQAYMKEMVAGHKKAITAISKEGETGSGAAKKWAEETLPTIKEHMTDAEKVNTEVHS